MSWNVVNLLTGLLVYGVSRDKFGRGLASQFVGWAVINMSIAVFGAESARRRAATLPDANTPARQVTEARNLRRLLWINAGLDVVYMIAGTGLMRRRGARSWLRGVGLGILFQGAFLLVFDVTQAQIVPEPPTDGFRRG